MQYKMTHSNFNAKEVLIIGAKKTGPRNTALHHDFTCRAYVVGSKSNCDMHGPNGNIRIKLEHRSFFVNWVYAHGYLNQQVISHLSSLDKVIAMMHKVESR